MSIDPARIEAAARAMAACYGDDWQNESAAVKRAWKRIAKPTLEAAFPEFVPEIFDGLPHAWIAPWEATETMRRALVRVSSAEMHQDGFAHRSKASIYRAMRDAHLSREQSE